MVCGIPCLVFVCLDEDIATYLPNRPLGNAMIVSRTVLIVCSGMLGFFGAFEAALTASSAVDFNRDIKPIFSDHCYACHGPDANKRKADLRFDVEESAKADLGGYAAIVPGNTKESVLMERLLTHDEDEIMPPPKFKKPLSSDQIDLIKRWIEDGASWANHWSFEPIQRPETPEISEADWSRNPIDRFVGARLDEEGLDPRPEAERDILIRRVSFDLTGLPPTPEEVDLFLEDQSGDAYEKLVDRLLRSSRYGEHMARFWLDAARYGDTHGLHLDNYREMWPYRDWVVNAFNRNLSYRDFVIEQLAGDLLPNATSDQLVATGFNRCNVSTSEGGSIKEEVYVRNVIDRVVTTSTVFMGLTFECTRCHDHKFDPLTMKDFYSFFAYFNSIDGEPLDGNRKEHAPVLRLPSDIQTEKIEKFDQEIALLDKKTKGPWTEVDQAQTEWEAELTATKEDADEKDENGALVLNDWYSVGPFSDVRLYLLPRKHGPEGKPIDLKASYKTSTEETVTWKRRTSWKDGVVHSDLTGDTAANFLYRVIESPKEQVVKVSLGSDDGIKVYLNEKELLSKDVSRGAAADQEMVDLALKKGRNELLLKIANYGGNTGFYFALVDGLSTVPKEILEIVAITPDSREPKQIDQLRGHFRSKVSDFPELVAANDALKTLRESRAAVDRDIPLTLIWKERKEPRKSFMLTRGEYDQKGDEVTRQTPAVLPPLPEGASNDRLGLALWLTDSSHPLTARVAVNRFWQQFFGIGLVKTSEDFGSQGDPPSHPKLLDWLAASFQENDWDVKSLVKSIVMSATYRQSSKMDPMLIERDPENRLFARGPRFRLDAEMLRDQALSVSGLLVEMQGGSSVKPPQPDGLWFAVGYSGSNTVRFEADQGADKVHRRSLYTFVKRTSPPPQMSTFDGPSREACVMRRERTNTPMQALLLLNDPQFVEAARALAERVLGESDLTDRLRADRMWRLCLGRFASPQELDDLTTAFQEEKEFFESDLDAAEGLIAIGDSEAMADLDRSELAAWTTVASLLLNLDEVVTKN